MNYCVSKANMSPLTAVLKCPHDEGGYISDERVGEEETTAADGA